MQEYTNLSGESNVISYMIGNDYIIVRFMGGREIYYKYTYDSAGITAVEAMKLYAKAGQGLNGYLATKPYHPHAKKGNSLEEVL
jgi:hypothetical protein